MILAAITDPHAIADGQLIFMRQLESAESDSGRAHLRLSNHERGRSALRPRLPKAAILSRNRPQTKPFSWLNWPAMSSLTHRADSHVINHFGSWRIRHVRHGSRVLRTGTHHHAPVIRVALRWLS